MWRCWRRLIFLLPVFLLAACGPGATPPITGGSPNPALSPSPSPAGPSASPSPSPATSPAPTACRPVTGGAAGAYPAITDFSVGAHPGYDRLVVEFTGPIPPYRIEANPWTSPPGGLTFTGGPKGDTVTVAGGFGVQVRFDSVDWARDSFAHGTDLSPGYATLKEVRLAENFEGVVRLAVGLDHSVCPLVTTLGSPARLVIDFPS